MKEQPLWTELVMVSFVAVGFILSISLGNLALGYLVVLLAGALAARLYYFKIYSKPTFPFVILILGFILGVLVTSFWTSRLFVLIVFGIGYSLSYYLHLKNILVNFKSDDFIK
jgi:hypothetical protein